MKISVLRIWQQLGYLEEKPQTRYNARCINLLRKDVTDSTIVGKIHRKGLFYEFFVLNPQLTASCLIISQMSIMLGTRQQDCIYNHLQGPMTRFYSSLALFPLSLFLPLLFHCLYFYVCFILRVNENIFNTWSHFMVVLSKPSIYFRFSVKTPHSTNWFA